MVGEDDERLALEDLLPSPDAGPEALYARNLLLDELELAIDELPEEQREVFVAHELEGRRSQTSASSCVTWREPPMKRGEWIVGPGPGPKPPGAD